MERQVVAAFVEFVQRMNWLGASGDNLLVRKERVKGLDLHSEGLCLGAHEAAYVAKGLDAEGLALNLRAGSGSELSAGHEDHHGDGELGHGVGVLAGGVHHHHAGFGGGLEVDIVVARACAHDYLKFGSRGDNLGGHFVRTDDDGLNVFDGLDQIGLLGVFLELDDLMAGGFEDLSDAFHGRCREGLLGCEKDFHGL